MRAAHALEFMSRSDSSAALTELVFDDYDLARFRDLAAGFGSADYAYVVTPNADHLIRLAEDAAFRDLYSQARYVLLDSRFIARIVAARGGPMLPVCAGSDLTASLFSEVIRPDDPLILIGARDEQAQQLRERYGLRLLEHHNPPMGFIRDPDAVRACLEFIEARSPFRFCLIGVGSPQQEHLAQALAARGRARGLALCIGASVDFLTGVERRAPRWVQRIGMEWLFRLLQSPRRLARRYLIRGPRVFALLRRSSIRLRRGFETKPPADSSHDQA